MFCRVHCKAVGRDLLDEDDLLDLDSLSKYFGVDTTEEIISSIREAHRHEKHFRGEDTNLCTKILKFWMVLKTLPDRSEAIPEVICLIGVNGSGKTTTSAKLGYGFDKYSSSILAACDTFRAAATEQLVSWATIGLADCSGHHGADSAAVAFDASLPVNQGIAIALSSIRQGGCMLKKTSWRNFLQLNVLQKTYALYH